MELQKPSLYELAADGRSLNLLAAVCDDCGYTNFPANDYGCLQCGAEGGRLRRTRLSGKGVLRNFVTLHQPLAGVTAPAVVGEVEIAENVIVEVLIKCDSESALRTGLAVQAVAEPETNAGQSKLTCRFVPVEAQP